MQLWNEFMKMVKAEYELLTTYKDVKITSVALTNCNDIKDNDLLYQDSEAHIVTYEVEVEVNGVKEKVTLATAINSSYSCDC